MLRESEGFMKIGKLPKRSDFDANLERYQQVEAEAARAAMAAALPGQAPQSTPRTDAATPRGPGASGNVPAQFASGLRPLNQQGAPPLGLNVGAIGDGMQTAGAQLSARTQELQSNLGNLSARAGAWFGQLGNNIGKAAELIPTQQNKETRAARKIQTAWRSCAARGHFHEERGAVLMLQSAQRRVRAQKAAAYKKALKYWAATVIQERWRRHQLRKKAKEMAAATEAATPKKTGFGAKIVKSLSFSRRSAKKSGPKPSMPDDLAPCVPPSSRKLSRKSSMFSPAT